MSERAAVGNLDEEGADFVKDTCSKVVTELSERYQDTPPDDIPDSEMDATFNEIAEDCLDQELLESDYC